MKLLPALLVITLAGCSGGNTPRVPSSDATGTDTSDSTSDSSTTDSGTTDSGTTDSVDQGSDSQATQSTLNLLDKSQELINSAAGHQLDQLAIVVDDLAFVVEQTTTLVWPNADYYQVQNPLTFAAVCNGGTDCKVVPGEYLVVNQTSNTREFLDIPFVETADQINATQLSQTTYSIEDAIGGPIAMPLDRYSYACEGGGNMTKLSGAQAVTLNSFFYTLRPGRFRLTRYEFDQCKMVVRDGVLPNGDYLLQGSFQHIYTRSYNLDESDENSFEAFSLTGDDGLMFRVQGQALTSDANGGFIQSRDATIGEYQKTLPNGQIAERLTDVQYQFYSTFGSAPFYYTETFNVSGNYRSLEAGDQLVTIKTDPTMARTKTRSDTNLADGQIELLAEDGSFLYVSGNSYVDPDIPLFDTPLLIDLDYTDVNGQQFQSARVARLLRVDPQLCEVGQINRIKKTGRNECTTFSTTDTPVHRQIGYDRPIIVP